MMMNQLSFFIISIFNLSRLTFVCYTKHITHNKREIENGYHCYVAVFMTNSILVQTRIKVRQPWRREFDTLQKYKGFFLFSKLKKKPQSSF